MSWQTSPTTWVNCDDRRHEGSRQFMVVTGYAVTVRDAMIKQGWGYDHNRDHHTCPTCVTRNILRN